VIASLNSINWFVFAMETQSVFSVVGTEFLNIIMMKFQLYKVLLGMKGWYSFLLPVDQSRVSV
jgi:hypothetical protein